MDESTAFEGVAGDTARRLLPAALLKESQGVVDGASLLAVAEQLRAAARMRAALSELVPVVEAMAQRCPEGSDVRATALLSVGEARRRLDAGPRPLDAVRYAERMGRSVMAMCCLVGRLSAQVGAGHVLAWQPPQRGRLELVSCGQAWDAVKVPGHIGESVLARLGEETGAVIEDPRGHVWYWLVLPGAPDNWIECGAECLGMAAYVVVPPADRTEGLGVRWRVPLSSEHYLTEASALRKALAAETAS
ncbi:DUF6415 family natural product biosynthesis protein [Streptomyces sp. CA2R106]|uniref:DUF6415 family natural product biosynthesis protein n=1 Tax=Streptomyces sp. CA2R106 TaxID=3120153 RepID=UPI00300944AC